MNVAQWEAVLAEEGELDRSRVCHAYRWGTCAVGALWGLTNVGYMRDGGWYAESDGQRVERLVGTEAFGLGIRFSDACQAGNRDLARSIWRRLKAIRAKQVRPVPEVAAAPKVSEPEPELCSAL